MRDIRFRSAAIEISSQWEVQRGCLEHSLAVSPESRSAWLWRIQLRICTFLIRRYGGPPGPPIDAPTQADQSTARSFDPSPEPGRAASIRRVFPSVEKRRRLHIRTRQHPSLERLAVVGDDARGRTARLVQREVAKQASCQATWDRIAFFSMALLIAVVAFLMIMILVAVALIYSIPMGVIRGLLIMSSVLTLTVLAVTRWRRRAQRIVRAQQ